MRKIYESGKTLVPVLEKDTVEAHFLVACKTAKDSVAATMSVRSSVAGHPRKESTASIEHVQNGCAFRTRTSYQHYFSPSAHTRFTQYMEAMLRVAVCVQYGGRWRVIFATSSLHLPAPQEGVARQARRLVCTHGWMARQENSMSVHCEEWPGRTAIWFVQDRMSSGRRVV